MSPQAFDFYITDKEVDPVGSILYDQSNAYRVIGLQHQEDDEKKEPIGMVCEGILGQGSELIVTRDNCEPYQISVDQMPGYAQAVWAMISKEIEDLKTKLRSV